MLANKLMSIFSFMAAEEADEIATQAFKRFTDIVNIVLPVLMSILLVLGMFYGIQLGVKYAKAEDDDTKKNAQKALINCVVGILIAIVFIAVIQIILNQNFVKRMFNRVDPNSGI